MAKLKNAIRRRWRLASEKRRYAGLALKKLPLSGFCNYVASAFAAPSKTRINVASGLHLELRENVTDLRIFEQIFLLEDCGFQLPEFQPQLIIDGGAHIGCATIYFANKYPDAQIIAVEAQSSNFEQLRRNVEHLPNVKIVHAAIYGSSGRRVALSNPDDDGWAFQFRSCEAAREPVESVETISIDQLIQDSDCDRCDLLKLDIEGAECDVFRAETAWLSSVSVLIVELHDRFQVGCTDALRAAIAKHDFRHERTSYNHVYVNQHRVAVADA